MPRSDTMPNRYRLILEESSQVPACLDKQQDGHSIRADEAKMGLVPSAGSHEVEDGPAGYVVKQILELRRTDGSKEALISRNDYASNARSME